MTFYSLAESQGTIGIYLKNPNYNQNKSEMSKRKDALKGGLHPDARLRNKTYTLKDKLKIK